MFSIQAKHFHEGGIQKFQPVCTVWARGKQKKWHALPLAVLSFLRFLCGTRAIPVEEALMNPSELVKLLGTFEI
jgi:hypothetical protein